MRATLSEVIARKVAMDTKKSEQHRSRVRLAEEIAPNLLGVDDQVRKIVVRGEILAVACYGRNRLKAPWHLPVRSR
jgi:hypothetical protein